MMTDIEIIMETVRSQLSHTMASDPDYYSRCEIILSNEQQFVYSRDRKPNAVFIVLKALPAQTTFGQRVIPVTINAVAERNKIEMCQRLLNEFANTYNLENEDMEDGDSYHYVMQTYTTPAVSSNFNEIYDGYRSLFYMSGNFLISETANVYKLVYIGALVPTITNGFTIDVQNDTQAKFDSKDFTKSRPMIGTLSITFTTHLVSTGITGDLIQNALVNKNINKTYPIVLSFKSGAGVSRSMRLVNMTCQQNAAEMPVASITMTE